MKSSASNLISFLRQQTFLLFISGRGDRATFCHLPGSGSLFHTNLPDRETVVMVRTEEYGWFTGGKVVGGP